MASLAPMDLELKLAVCLSFNPQIAEEGTLSALDKGISRKQSQCLTDNWCQEMAAVEEH